MMIDAFAVLSLLAGSVSQIPQEPREVATSTDYEVVATMLEDLVSYSGEDSPIDDIFSPDPLRLDPVPTRGTPTVDGLLEQSNPEAWRDLSPADTEALRRAAKDYVRRSKRPAAPFTSGSEHVPLYTGDRKKASLRDRPISASLPGYSPDGRLSIVTVSIPWSIHGCSGVYVLSKDGTGWRVRVRDFACYL
jgi:hypothetical protein